MNDYILVFVYRIVFAMFDIAVLGYSQIHNNNGEEKYFIMNVWNKRISLLYTYFLYIFLEITRVHFKL